MKKIKISESNKEAVEEILKLLIGMLDEEVKSDFTVLSIEVIKDLIDSIPNAKISIYVGDMHRIAVLKSMRLTNLDQDKNINNLIGLLLK